MASAARRSYGEALVICFRGGAFSAVLDITLCVAGVTLLYVTLYTWYVARGVLDETDIPVLMVGYGFGASFVALFMQVWYDARREERAEGGKRAVWRRVGVRAMARCRVLFSCRTGGSEGTLRTAVLLGGPEKEEISQNMWARGSGGTGV